VQHASGFTARKIEPTQTEPAQSGPSDTGQSIGGAGVGIGGKSASDKGGGGAGSGGANSGGASSGSEAKGKNPLLGVPPKRGDCGKFVQGRHDCNGGVCRTCTGASPKDVCATFCAQTRDYRGCPGRSMPGAQVFSKAQMEKDGALFSFFGFTIPDSCTCKCAMFTSVSCFGMGYSEGSCRGCIPVGNTGDFVCRSADWCDQGPDPVCAGLGKDCSEETCCAGLYCRGSGCFAAGTKVLTPHGAVDIEKLSKGDRVWSIDPVNHKLVAVVISEQRSHATETILRVRFSDGSVTLTTPEHPFWDPALGQYREIGGFKAGEKVSFLAGGWDGESPDGTVEELPIAGIETLPPEKTTVYNLTVDGPFSNYIAGGAIVHNKPSYSTCKSQP
jgi:hypothetical protein